jgi:cytochrome c peroxidase
MSCHTCHPDGHTSGLRADTPADDGFGAPKRIPTLLGTRDAAPWNWSGKSGDLAGLIGRTVAGTMHGKELSADRLADLEAYLRSLDPPPPATRTTSTRGKELFEHHGCAACHNPATAYTSSKGSDVGLTDERGTRRFHPPSLRGVGQGSAFYHDGRAKTLDEVFTTHPHAKTGDVPAADRAELLRFLRGL